MADFSPYVEFTETGVSLKSHPDDARVDSIVLTLKEAEELSESSEPG
jgi:hypothetical protein